MNFLVFSDDWGEHPSSCQHLFKRISQKHRVLWVNTIGMRKPRPAMSDLKKALYKVRRMLNSSNDAGKDLSCTGLTVCQPPMLPFIGLPGIRRINSVSVIRTIRSRLTELGMQSPILVTTVPNACDYIGKCGESKVIYYCVDDFTHWPGLENEKIRDMEQDLIRKSDLLLATSQKLYEKLFRSGKPTHLLAHGVDVDFFRQPATEEHPLLSRIPKPRVGYFGLFDERTDHDLLADVAASMPDVSFVITGRVESEALLRRGIGNIHFTGPVAYAEIPQMLGGCDALIIPYVVNDLTDSISPLKLKEYLATGKPVVSTPIPEVLRLKQYVHIAETPSEWGRAIRTCLDHPEGLKQKLGEDFWANETWDKKVEQFFEICNFNKSIEVQARTIPSTCHFDMPR